MFVVNPIFFFGRTHSRFFAVTLGEEAAYFQLERGRFEIERSGRFLLFVGDMTVAGDDLARPNNGGRKLQRRLLSG